MVKDELLLPKTKTLVLCSLFCLPRLSPLVFPFSGVFNSTSPRLKTSQVSHPEIICFTHVVSSSRIYSTFLIVFMFLFPSCLVFRVESYKSYQERDVRYLGLNYRAYYLFGTSSLWAHVVVVLCAANIPLGIQSSRTSTSRNNVENVCFRGTDSPCPNSFLQELAHDPGLARILHQGWHWPQVARISTSLKLGQSELYPELSS